MKALFCAALLLAATTLPTAAQNVPPPGAVAPADSAAEAAVSQGVTPRGAFLRSLVMPGWGQAAAGSYSRAIFYAVAEAASATMIIKSHQFLGSARDRVALRIADAERRAALAGIVEPDSVLAFVDEDESVVGARGLEESRLQQREDWIAFGLFMLFLGGADAFVSAHLSDFPDPLVVNPVPGQEGPPAIEVGIRLPAPWDRPPSR